MTSQRQQRAKKAKRAKERRREELLIREMGGGIGDLSQGAVTRYAPTLLFTDAERDERIALHRGIGCQYPPGRRLADGPSQECLDALAVWHPLALRHLLSLDARPQLRLVDARRRVRETRELHEHLGEIVEALDSTRTALERLASDERVGRLAGTHSALTDVVQIITTGTSSTSRSLSRADVTSDKVDTLNHVDHIVFFLRSDVLSLRRRAASQVRSAETDVGSITGAKHWSGGQSLHFSRRLVTLRDSLRSAYPDGRWTWRRLATLVRASSTDWTTPPCPDVAAGEISDMLPMLKMRATRERERREKLKLSSRDVYPWLPAGNNPRSRP